MAINNTIHFGIRIKGTSSNLTLYDDSAGTDVDLTIPEGVYFHKHCDPNRDLVYVVNSVLGSYGHFNRVNDRQLELILVDPNDYISFPDTDDRQVLCESLGCYSNAGTYTDNYTDNDITQVCATSFYSENGYLYDSRDLKGFPEFSSEHFPTEGGTVAVICGQRKQQIDLTLTTIQGSLLNGSFELGSQEVYKTTLNPDSSVSLWKAYDPTSRQPQLYLDSDSYGNFTYYLRSPITSNDIKQTVSQQNLYYDLTLGLTLNLNANDQVYFLESAGASGAGFIADSSDFDTQGFTVGFDITLDDYSADQGILQKFGAYTATGTEWSIVKTTAGNFEFNLFYNATDSTSLTGLSLVDKTQYKIICWYNRTTTTMHYEAYKVSGGTVTTDSVAFGGTDRKVNQSAPINILGYNQSVKTKGFISKLFYFNGALTSDERAEYYSDGIPPQFDHYWPCDEQTGDIAVDCGGSLNADISAGDWGEIT